MAEGPTQTRLAVVTAGSPGAGKSTVARTYKTELVATDGTVLSYCDPDDVSLKEGMPTTYSLEPRTTPEESIATYNKWRAGSNASAHICTARTIAEGRALLLGTTASSDKTHLFFQHLKDQGYFIRLLHVSAEDDVRVESIKLRDKEFVQTTPEDIAAKGDLVPQRIDDYLKYADEILFYSRTEADGPATHAATWTRAPDEGSNAKLDVLDEEALAVTRRVHDTVCDKLGMEDLKWSPTVETSLAAPAGK